MPTMVDGTELPIEITVETQAENSARVQSNGLTEFREMNDSAIENLSETTQRESMQEVLPEEYQNGIEFVGTITCEEMDPEIGAVPDTSVVVGKNFCYSNQLNGIRLENNFYKVCTDVDGVYCTINKWREVVGTSEETTQNTQIKSIDEVLGTTEYSENGSSETMELVYVPISETSYRLCYAVTSEEVPTYYIDVITGDVVEMFVD